MIKRIGTLARAEIEAMNGQKVYLDLTVKVHKDWKNDPAFLRELGFSGKAT
jgi:GTP-binding protein Era